MKLLIIVIMSLFVLSIAIVGSIKFSEFSTTGVDVVRHDSWQSPGN